ncbi:MAG: hypothetical protein ABII25_06945 [bacterium]
MNIQTLNPNQIKQVGLKALILALGPVGMVRFLQQFETGYGDYTKDRDKWLGKINVRQVVKEIKLKRNQK